MQIIMINISICYARLYFYFYSYFVFTRSTLLTFLQNNHTIILLFIGINFLRLHILLSYTIENNRECTQLDAYMPAEMYSKLLWEVSAFTHTSQNLLRTSIVIIVQFLSEFSPSLLLLMYEY